MVARPRFHSRRTQDAVVAFVMAVLLLFSLGAAYALSASRKPPQAKATRVDLGGLTVTLPDRWRSADASDLPQDLTPRRFADPQRPTRLVTVLRVPTPAAWDPAAVMRAALPPLLGPGVQTLDALDHVPHRLPAVEWSGVSPTPDGLFRAHMAAVVSGSPNVHWLLYVTDRVQPNEDPSTVLRSNLGLLRGLIQSATLTPSRSGR